MCRRVERNKVNSSEESQRKLVEKIGIETNCHAWEIRESFSYVYKARICREWL